MANAKKSVKGYMDQFTTMHKALTDHAATMYFKHHAAFVKAGEALLMDSRGELDYDRLKNGDTRLAMANAMADYHTKEMQPYFGVDFKKLGNDPLAWLKKEQLFREYTGGLTAGTLKATIDANQEDFTLERMASIGNEAKQTHLREFLPSTFAHIPDTEPARTAVLGEIGLTGKINPGIAKLEELVQWMVQYHVNGGVPRTAYERSQAYIKPTAAPHP